MNRYMAEVTVRKIDTVADPEGKTITEALRRLGFDDIEKVRTGKVFFVNFKAEDENRAHEILEKVSHDVLSNPIIENFDFELKEVV